MCVRIMSPLSTAAWTMLSVEPGTRTPIAHFVIIKSWACMAPIQPTKSLTFLNLDPAICWLISRAVAMSFEFTKKVCVCNLGYWFIWILGYWIGLAVAIHDARLISYHPLLKWP